MKEKEDAKNKLYRWFKVDNDKDLKWAQKRESYISFLIRTNVPREGAESKLDFLIYKDSLK